MRKDHRGTRVFTFIAASTTLLFGAGLFLYHARAQVSVQPDKSTASNISLIATDRLGRTETKPYIPTEQKAPMLEVHIANNGLMLLRGARVISISNNIIRVITDWHSISFTWGVETKFLFTKFTVSGGKPGTIKDIQVGDILTITGKLTRSDPELIISGEFISK